MRDLSEIFGTLIFGIAIGFIIGAAFIPPSPDEKIKVICEYKGGSNHGDLCVKDGIVIDKSELEPK